MNLMDYCLAAVVVHFILCIVISKLEVRSMQTRAFILPWVFSMVCQVLALPLFHLDPKLSDWDKLLCWIGRGGNNNCNLYLP